MFTRAAFLLRALRFACMVACVVVLSGCEHHVQGPTLYIPDWTFRFEGHEEKFVLPKHFRELLPNRPTRYVLHTDVVLPEDMRHHDLTLAIPFFPGITSLEANGRPMVTLDRDLVEVYRASGPHTWSIPREVTSNGTLSLDLIVRHEWSNDAYWDTIPRLVFASTRDTHTELVRAINNVTGGFAFVALLQIGFTYLAVFMVDRRRRAYIWFAIQALCASFYHVFVIGFSQLVFRRYDVSLLAAFLAAAPISSIYFTHALFNMKRPSHLWLVLLGINTTLVIATFGPWGAQPIAAKATVPIVGLTVVYQIAVTTRLCFRKPRPMGAPIVLACWIALLLTAWSDSASWLGLGEPLGGIRSACFGLSVFSILQSLILSREHIFTLNRSDDLNAQLAGRIELLEKGQQEIQVLNDELRRQITDRSRQLFAALALVGGRAEDAPLLKEGDVVQQRYRIVREVGKGGMGAVYEAIRVTDQKRLALKVTHGLDGIALARLAREAQIASQVSHPNVVTILDVDVAASGFLYVVMEFVQGPSLAEQKNRFGDLKWGLRILKQIAEGLDALHKSGIVHRDLKPANVLVNGGGDSDTDVKITDFGISRLTDAAADEVSEGEPIHRPSMAKMATSAETVRLPASLRPAAMEPPRGPASVSPMSLDMSERDMANLAPDPTMMLSNGDAPAPSSNVPPPPTSKPDSETRDDLPRSAPSSAIPSSFGGPSIILPSTMNLPASIVLDTGAGSAPSIAFSTTSGVAGPIPNTTQTGSRVFAGRNASTLTQAGHITGTPIYMAPEVTSGAKVKLAPSADIFSLGILAFEILARKYPFREPPALARIRKKSVPPPIAIRTICTELAPDVADLIDSCLSVDAAARPTARAFADRLAIAMDQAESPRRAGGEP